MKVKNSFYGLEASIERGYPQVSVLAPALWKLVLIDLIFFMIDIDDFFGVFEEEPFSFTEHVGDSAAVNSRAGLKQQREPCDKIGKKWCKRKKFMMATSNTPAILLKGIHSLKTSSSWKFLGSPLCLKFFVIWYVTTTNTFIFRKKQQLIFKWKKWAFYRMNIHYAIFNYSDNIDLWCEIISRVIWNLLNWIH